MARALIALTLAVAVAVLSAPAAAQASCEMTSGNVYRASACAGYTVCASSYCTCTGTSGSSDQCLATSTANCSTFTKCTANFIKCLNDLAGVARLNSTDPCNSWAVLLHAQLLNSAIGTYNGSALQQACTARVCELRNRTSLSNTTCTLGVNASQACMAGSGVAISTSAPVTNASGAILIRAQIRLSGNWTGILSDPVKYAALAAALQNDIAALLGVPPELIVIVSLTSGSLVIDFAVREGANVSIASLESKIATATSNSTWLASTVSYAAANGGPTSITVTGAGVVTTTVAGQTTTGAPSISSASTVSAAVVAVLAALAMLF